MRRNKIATFIVIVVLISTVVACGIFLSPQRERENPLDPLNVLAIVTDFWATPLDDNTVRLTWNVPEGGTAIGVIIIRKEDSEPTNRFDGIELIDVDLDSGEFTDTDVTASNEYWYSAWVYDDTEERYTGPVSDRAFTQTISASLSPIQDGWFDYLATVDFSNQQLDVGRDWRVSLLEFDVAGYYPVSANLYLRSNWGSTANIGLYLVVQSWDISTPWATVNAPSFVDTGTGNFFSFTGGSNGYLIDIKDIVLAWASGTPNNGIRMESDTFGWLTYFHSNESLTDVYRPYLQIDYYE